MSRDQPTKGNSPFSAAWEIIRDSNSNSQVALAIAVLVLWMALMTVFAFVFGCVSRPNGFVVSLVGGVVGLLCTMGAFAVGGILGLLFGSPGMGSSTASTGSAIEDSHKSGHQQSINFRPNTSLERVSEWLTTMIVGLSLVHLRSIASMATEMSVLVTAAISGDAKSTNGTPGIVIVLSAGFAGFVLVYLWAMRFLPAELRQSFSSFTQRLETVEAKSAKLLQEFKARSLFSVPKGTLAEMRAQLTAAGVGTETVDEVVRRYATASTGTDEPMKDFGPSSDNGLALSAHVESVGSGRFSLVVKITVSQEVDVDYVFWLLHNTFAPAVMHRCPVEGGVAEYTTIVDESFWIGALAPVGDGSVVRLGMDLALAADSPPEFRAA